MPWIKQEMCTGCGICIEECPVDTIKLEDNDYAVINEEECIRCGRCHDVCPQDAVRHDGERVPQEVAANLKWVRKLLENFQQPEEQTAFMQRMVRFFNKEKKVNEQTIDAIKNAQDDPVRDIENAIHNLPS